MRLFRLAIVPGVALLIAACSPGTGASPTPSTTATAAPSNAPSATASATRIDVQLTDAFKIEPVEMSVAAGVPVTFVVTNTGAIAHEFYVGDEAAQGDHEQEMQAMGGMQHDEDMGISVDPGQTKELTVMFPAAGSILAGCHVAGHYGAGMKAAIEIGS